MLESTTIVSADDSIAANVIIEDDFNIENVESEELLSLADNIDNAYYIATTLQFFENSGDAEAEETEGEAEDVDPEETEDTKDTGDSQEDEAVTEDVPEDTSEDTTDNASDDTAEPKTSAEEELEAIDGEDETETEEETTYTYAEASGTMWATGSVHVRSGPSTSFGTIGYLAKNDSVTITGKCNETGWYQCTYKEQTAYVSCKYLTDEEPTVTTTTSSSSSSSGKSYNGIYEGDVISGTATYYDVCVKCCGSTNGITASGRKIQNGVTPTPGVIACNWLPLGTIVSINGVEYEVADRGGSSLNTKGRVDIFTPEGHAAALALGRKSVTITIVSLP